MLKDLSYHLLLEIQGLARFWKSKLVFDSEIKTNTLKNSSRHLLIQNSCLSINFNKSIPIPQLAYSRLNSPHNLASLQQFWRKYTVCFLKAVTIWSSQQRLFRGFEVWGLHVTGGTQFHWYLAGDGEVSRAISLRFKCGQKAPYPRNRYTSEIMVSTATESIGATSFLLFMP